MSDHGHAEAGRDRPDTTNCPTLEADGMSNDQAYAGTAEGQGPVRITSEIDRHLENKREELFEEFEIADAFPPEVLREAEARTDDVQNEIQSEVDERTDLRDLTTWTTDPVDAQDFDDAISIEREDDGRYHLWVHIADVTHYVHPGSAMWKEAVERGSTVYLPGYTVHMLPPVLAETVCSLVPNEDRLAGLINTVDCQTIAGSAMSPSQLEDLGIEQVDMLVAVTNDGIVRVVDPGTGDVRATYERDASVYTHVTLADLDDDGRDEVYVPYGDGRVVALQFG